MVLSKALKGQNYIIEKIELKEDVTRRMHTLGLTDGTKISVLNKKRNGPMIIKVRGTRFALGKGFLDGIFIREMLG